MQEWNETANKLLDAAEAFITSRGFNAFSFKDLQNEVGVKTSTIHYYFSTKSDLGKCAVARFFEKHKLALGQLDKAGLTATARLQQVSSFFEQNSKKGEFCLGGMLSSDIRTLDDSTADVLSDFFDHFEKWIEATIKDGQQQGEFKQNLDSKKFARMFLATLEGGMLIARVRRTDSYYKTLLDELIEQLK